MSYHSSHDGFLREKLVLTAGFLAVIAGVGIAHRTPASGYELSMYAMTPSIVWICLGIALLSSLSVAVAFRARAVRSLRAGALLLGGAVTTVFVGIPIIRGYHFNGHNDALTHLGWASGISDGVISPFELFYPGIHTASVVISSTLDVPLTRSLLYVSLLATLVFFVFVPLAVREIDPDPSSVVVSAFCAFLLLPITTITTNLYPHAMSQTILLSALPIYVLLKYTTTDSPTRISAIGVLFFVLTVATVVYHPQYLAHMIIAAAGICSVQYFAKRVGYGGAIDAHRPLYGQVLLMIVVFVLWSGKHGFFAGFASRALGSAITFLLTGSGQAGHSVASQGASLQAIGGGLGEIFMKLFVVHLVVSLFAGGLLLRSMFRGYSIRFPHVSAVGLYITVVLFNLGFLFVLYFVSQTSEMYFRVFGLMMVFVTIFGAVAINRTVNVASQMVDQRIVNGAFVVGCGVLLVLSLLSVYPSPFVYNQSHHVSEMQMSGYETAFSNQDAEIEFVGFRNAPNRYDDALRADADRSRGHGSVSESTFEQPLRSAYEEETYLVLTRIDYEREVGAYEGLRYSEEDFAVDTTQSGINRVQSNGEYELYHLTGSAG